MNPIGVLNTCSAQNLWTKLTFHFVEPHAKRRLELSRLPRNLRMSISEIFNVKEEKQPMGMRTEKLEKRKRLFILSLFEKTKNCIRLLPLTKTNIYV
nr:unnamed protein product [Callosobruchus chinensis]